MSIVKRALTAGVSILMMAGCSRLEQDLPSTVQSIDGETCETCHPLVPQTKSHVVHLNDTIISIGCRDCHRGYDDSLGWVDASLHRNGLIDTIPGECDYCHLYRRYGCRDCHETPPVDTPKRAKVHQHVSQQQMACDSCHKGYDIDKRTFVRELHDNGRADVVFDVTGKPGFPAQPWYSNDSCYNLYCHGANTIGGKPAVAINDTEPPGADKCSFCHDLNGLYLSTPDHSAQGHDMTLFRDCLNCHKGFSANLLTTDEAIHRDGKIDTIPLDQCNLCHQVPVVR